LARVEAGKTGIELRRRQNVFPQGDPADAVFYIQKGIRLEKSAMVVVLRDEPAFSALF
jgi:hypothetical protein